MLSVLDLKIALEGVGLFSSTDYFFTRKKSRCRSLLLFKKAISYEKSLGKKNTPDEQAQKIFIAGEAI